MCSCCCLLPVFVYFNTTRPSLNSPNDLNHFNTSHSCNLPHQMKCIVCHQCAPIKRCKMHRSKKKLKRARMHANAEDIPRMVLFLVTVEVLCVFQHGSTLPMIGKSSAKSEEKRKGYQKKLPTYVYACVRV